MDKEYKEITTVRRQWSLEPIFYIEPQKSLQGEPTECIKPGALSLSVSMAAPWVLIRNSHQGCVPEGPD
ncbi:hypothetical protein GDO81_021122 [Engystomops pustulosus]|uniref:Uncharacterized protein n=1 Tax=Engystomops pustulosus TaxID=76066 RepID=A0AAV6YPD0_ENGPU|nr:hypothetical protein GDO81_021122 [Engystomops pustulosus]